MKTIFEIIFSVLIGLLAVSVVFLTGRGAYETFSEEKCDYEFKVDGVNIEFDKKVNCKRVWAWED